MTRVAAFGGDWLKPIIRANRSGLTCTTSSLSSFSSLEDEELVFLEALMPSPDLALALNEATSDKEEDELFPIVTVYKNK